MIVAVTLDIVGSRTSPDRRSTQRDLDAAIARAHADAPLTTRTLRPTVGDEQQGEYPDLESALAALLLLQLALPEGVDCRFGVGVGESTTVPSAGGEIREGPAWWAAREAIQRVHELQERSIPAARTWVVAADDAPDDIRGAVLLANPYLLARDELVRAMSPRSRRLAYGRCLGATQRELARSEGISQSAVSQSLAHAGARAVVAGYRILREGSRLS